MRSQTGPIVNIDIYTLHSPYKSHEIEELKLISLPFQTFLIKIFSKIRLNLSVQFSSRTKFLYQIFDDLSNDILFSNFRYVRSYYGASGMNFHILVKIGWIT